VARIFDLGDGFPPKRSRLLESVNFSPDGYQRYPRDDYGHGTHIAGIIGGNGLLSWGKYIGIAPKVNLVSVKVSDAHGMGYESDVVAGLQWIYENRDDYNIRVVNISLNSSVPQSYHTSPLDAAVEILWFNSVVVVVSAGNNAVGHNGILYPPANDPFVITVGATDDQGTPDTGDDLLANFSAFGTTEDGVAKPDLVAPGRNIVSISPGAHATLVQEHPDHRVDGIYFRMSGTSMSSAVTSGAVALLLQAQPGLNPDQVKWRLMHTTEPFAVEGAGAGYLNVHNAVRSESTETANTGQEVSRLLWTGPEPPIWDSVHWDSVHWDSVHWDSVHWDSVHWDSVHWDSVYWGNTLYSSSISWD
jgi:serine protease AprX